LALPEQLAWAEDARAQIARGQAAHARAFGAPPVGRWPPEGSVSPEAVAAYARAGVSWLATDEGNLWRSLQLAGRPHPPRGDLYRAWRFGGVDLVFRDREISDRIGFSYAHGDSAAGAADLLGRARACAAASTARDTPLVPIFLDGENAWESYPGSGEPFLRALFEGLAQDGQLRALSVGEHLRAAAPREELRALHSGSWIDSDFHIWIGDPVKNRAWELLGRARRRWERARSEGIPEAKLAEAYEHLLAAEGSDWFWWFGEPFHSAEDAIFDRLFRAHLAGALTALGDRVPEELERPVAPDAHAAHTAASRVRPPWAYIRPRIGESSFYAWHGAGTFDVPRGAAMAESPLVERIHFGFDPTTLYLRLEPAQRHAAELEGAALEVDISSKDKRLRLRVGAAGWTLCDPEGEGWRAVCESGPVSFGPRAIELAAPFARLGLERGARLELAFRLVKGEVALARYPSDGALVLTVPDDAFEADNWRT
ncbi:MAG TPA: hypothetical protein VMZ28_19325, partial [Kofleriaceae bacterium]|nr:hypothetical protein [Kofleriaceae bacterium]